MFVISLSVGQSSHFFFKEPNTQYEFHIYSHGHPIRFTGVPFHRKDTGIFFHTGPRFEPLSKSMLSPKKQSPFYDFKINALTLLSFSIPKQPHMRKNEIWFVPVGGLANRMRAIDSAVALSLETHSKLRIIWFKDHGLNCRFDQLFDPFDIPTVSVTEASWSDLLLYDRPRRKNFFIPRLPQEWLFDSRIYEVQAKKLVQEHFDFHNWAKGKKVYMASFVSFYSPRIEWKIYSIFKPQPNLIREIDARRSGFGPNTIGIHIRRTDNVISIAQSPTHLFIERMEDELKKNCDTTFYLATDSEEDKKRIIDQFGDRVFFSTQKADRNSVEGIQEALIELYLLSHTRQVLGSVYSSFSEAAAQIGNIPCTALQKT